MAASVVHAEPRVKEGRYGLVKLVYHYDQLDPGCYHSKVLRM